MLVAIIFFVLLCSFSFLMSAWKEWNFEETLPMTVASVMGILLLAGFARCLSAGFFVLLISMTISVVAGIVLWAKRGFIAERRKFFFSRGFFTFLAVYFLFVFLYNGRRIFGWDAIAQWGSSVKTMVYYDKFVCDTPLLTSNPAYPPGISLFQYFPEKIYSYLHPNDMFTEWLVYLAFSLVGVSFLLPIISKFDIKRTSNYVIVVLISFLLPLVFTGNYYDTLSIDGVEGVLFGCALFMLLAGRFDDIRYELYLISVMFVISMLRSDGIVLSGFIGLGYIIIKSYTFRKSDKSKRKSICKWGIFGAFSVLTPISIWFFYFNRSGVASINNKAIDLHVLWNLIRGNDTSYRAEVKRLFEMALFDTSICKDTSNFKIPNTTFSISFFALIMLLVLFFIIIQIRMKRLTQTENKRSIDELKVSAWLVFVVAWTSWVAYMAVIELTLLFQFIEYEALALASYDRYTSIVYSGILIFESCTSAYVLSKDSLIMEKKKDVLVIVIVIVMLLTPSKDVFELMTRIDASQSKDFYEKSEELILKINEIPKDINDVKKIWFVDQTSVGSTALECMLQAVPNRCGYMYEPWWFIESGNENEGKYGYTTISEEEWFDVLMDNYDYVAIRGVNPYFLETFSDLFEGEIHEYSIYKVDYDEKKLVFME